jgi:hypothetical protein
VCLGTGAGVTYFCSASEGEGVVVTEYLVVVEASIQRELREVER